MWESPTINGGMQNGSSVGIHTHCIHVFARLVPIFMLSRCSLANISAWKLSRKFIKSALLVGRVCVGVKVKTSHGCAHILYTHTG